MKIFGALFIFFSSVSFALAQDSSSNTSSLPTVDLGYEVHQATFNESGKYYNFSNIRYGAPPVGNLRFQAPVRPEVNGTAVFNDGSKPVVCIQTLPAWSNYSAAWIANGTAAFNISEGYKRPNITDPPTRIAGETEDCLFLDIMVPKVIFDKAGQCFGAPVMVWIHGGGYTYGSKVRYTPSAAGLLATSQEDGSEGVIWVSINYRLGIFGFLSGPTLQSNGTANAGLHDQRLALEWVQENIHKFGGDPKRVTVMGESAGGGSLMHQITAYGGHRGSVPFQQAIVQSPGFQMTPSAVGQESIFDRFLEVAKVRSLQDARSLSTDDLRFANYKIIGESYPYGTFTFNPVVDGNFVPALPGKLLLQGNFDKSLRLMVGHNVDEGRAFMDPFAQNDSQFKANLRLYLPTITNPTIDYISSYLYPPIFDGSYGYRSPSNRSNLLVTEAFFTCNTNWLAAAYGNRTFSYIFGVGPSLHGDDVAYTYYNGPAAAVKNISLAATMQNYFTNFAKTGTPNGPRVPDFQPYGDDSRSLNLNVSGIWAVKDSAANERCAWWQKGLYF